MSTATSESTHPTIVRISLLGSFRVSYGPYELPADIWRRQRKAALLLKLLALSPGCRLVRDVVWEALWPELCRNAAANNLRVLIHTTRRILDPERSLRAPSTVLHVSGDVLELAQMPAALVWTDVMEFERSSDFALKARDQMSLTAALALYAGDLLPDDIHVSWTMGRREHLKRLRRDMLIQLGCQKKTAGDGRDSIACFEAILESDPLDEEAAQELFTVLTQLGRGTEAKRRSQQFEAKLLQELGVTPSIDAWSPAPGVRQQLRNASQPFRPETPALPGDRPMHPRDFPERPGRLQSGSRFIGRLTELETLIDLLSNSRMVTVMGPPGVGKTRLVLESAPRLTSLAPDGIWVVELAGLTDPTLVPNLVATRMEVVEVPGAGLPETIVQFLRERQSLLVLDNCEHLVQPVAELAGYLIGHAPGLRILATSRCPVRVDQETTWQLPSLSLPESGVDSPDAVRQFEATRLFLDRASAITPGFTLSSINAPAILQICRVMGGLPLAIELAANLIRTLSVADIERRLDDSLPLLTVGRHSGEPRQQRMRSAIAWSYDLLSAAGQELLRRLSVFAGSFALDSAEIVAGSEFVARQGPMVNALVELVEQSLVVHHDAGGEERYSLLEPIRQFAASCTQTEEQSGYRRTHALATLQLSEEAHHQLESSGQKAWLDRLESDLDNIRAALGWGLEPGNDAAIALQIAANLRRFWEVRWHVSEGRQWIERSLQTGQTFSPDLLCFGTNAHGVLSTNLCDYDRASTAFTENLQRYRLSGDRLGEGLALVNLSVIARNLGNWEACRNLSLEALPIFCNADCATHEALTLHNLGVALRELGAFDAALAHLHKGLQIARELGHNHYMAAIRCRIAQVCICQGNLQFAREFANASLDDYREIADPSGMGMAERTLARIALALGDVTEAWLFARSALVRSVNGNILRQLPYDLELVCRLSLDAGDMASAALALGKADSLRASMHTVYGADDGLLDEQDRSLLCSGDNRLNWQRGWDSSVSDISAWAVYNRDCLAQPSESSRSSHALTPREQQVLTLIEQGEANKSIAELLGISPRTVETHVSRILQKTGGTRRSSLMRRAAHRPTTQTENNAVTSIKC